MSTRDDDILDFDFFDEGDAPAWQEPEGLEPLPPSERGRRGGGRRVGPPRNLTPLLRLIGLVALAILVVVVVAVWVDGCTSEAERDRNSTYLSEIGAIGNASARLGQQLGVTLTTPGQNQEDLDAKLGGYVQTAESQVQRAEDLDPPGAMVGPNTGAVEALQYRANGLRGLQNAFRETVDETEASIAGEQLLAQTQRLLASDIIWADSFQAPAEAVLQDEGIEGLDVPSSEFVTSDDFVSQSNLAGIWRRVQGASTGGQVTGIHGNQIDSVIALPSGTALSTTTETTIQATNDLAFQVSVTDSGESQEVRVKVTLTIPQQPSPIVKTSTIPLIDAGETKIVTFKVGALVPFGEQTTVKVDVDPVDGETNTSNNSYEYPVIFTL
ncbi:MAG TPA: CARDB domain-containing protein [Gaiellaceae bacterium]|nr:CARDB domain-containing protein [Gaiellaceae bacterium]